MGIFKSELLGIDGSMTERQNLTIIWDYLIGLDARITCNTTPDTQFDDTSNTATFDFDIDGKFQIRLQRGAVNSTATRAYYGSIIVNGNEYGRKADNIFGTNVTPDSGSANGGLRIASYIDTNVILICISQKNTMSSTNLPGHMCFAMITDGDKNYFAGYNNGSPVTFAGITSMYFYKTLDATAGYTVPKMINFTAPTGSICYSSILPVQNSNGLAFYCADIFSCSTVSIGANIALPNGKNYFAIDANAMVVID